jgi:asparagine synthetase B (glutamine-hydrolysing)
MYVYVGRTVCMRACVRGERKGVPSAERGTRLWGSRPRILLFSQTHKNFTTHSHTHTLPHSHTHTLPHAHTYTYAAMSSYWRLMMFMARGSGSFSKQAYLKREKTFTDALESDLVCVCVCVCVCAFISVKM